MADYNGGSLITGSRPIPPAGTAPLTLEQLVPLASRAEPDPLEHAFWCCQRALRAVRSGSTVEAVACLIAAQAFIHTAAEPRP